VPKPDRPKAEAAPASDVANFGLVRPPFVYLAALLIGLLLDFVRPLPFVPSAAGLFSGIAIILLAAALFVISMRTFRAAGTPVPGNQPTTAIVRTGPYLFSRNPIYLAFSLMLLGTALLLNSLWLVSTLVAAVLVMSLVVIPREEGYLARRFGSEYLAYKLSVRRWV
jgi:protein-S-isoprenylcysteine O-methyltransferase Ste14